LDYDAFEKLHEHYQKFDSTVDQSWNESVVDLDYETMRVWVGIDYSQLEMAASDMIHLAQIMLEMDIAHHQSLMDDMPLLLKQFDMNQLHGSNNKVDIQDVVLCADYS